MENLYLIAGCAAASIIIFENRKSKVWIKKKWLLKRKNQADISFLKELSYFPDDYRNFLRMDENSFKELLRLVTPSIRKKNTVMRECIPPNERLTATLRFLATGQSYESLKFSSRISAQALGKIIPETCRAIYSALKEEYLKFPNSKEEWEEISDEFYYKWEFPNCLGAVDGKHIAITRPANSGAYFYNYKGYYSTVLMAIVNAKYEFIYCNVGTNGRISDGGVIEYTDFYDDLVNNRLKIPPPKCPKKYDSPIPYVFISDEAFRLRKDWMKPFSKQDLSPDRELFNKRLSRARQVVENAFGILAARFRVFHTHINLDLNHIDYVVLASCVLHNFLRRRSSNYIDGPETGVTEQNPELIGLSSTCNRRIDLDGKAIREEFLQYIIKTKD